MVAIAPSNRCRKINDYQASCVYDVTAGFISVGGHDNCNPSRQINAKCVWVLLVLQDAWLFEGEIHTHEIFALVQSWRQLRKYVVKVARSYFISYTTWWLQIWK